MSALKPCRPDMSDLFDDIPRGLHQQSDAEMQAPRARWHSAEELTASEKGRYTPNKIFLGRIGNSYIGNDDDRHMMTIAGSRAGKGRACIIPNLLHYAGSTLVIDPKGENAAITAQRRHKMGQRVYVLDPFGRAPAHCEPFKAAFNPLSLLTLDNPYLIDDAAVIADALVVPSGNDPHWDETAKSFIEGLILHVITTPEFEGRRTLVTVYQLLMSGMAFQRDGEECDGMNGLRMSMRTNDALDGTIINIATEFFEKAENERNSVLSTARRHMKFIRSDAMQSILSTHNFDLDELHRQDTTIYLCLPATRLSANKRWLRLFVNMALEALEREKKRHDKPPVLMILDEFPILGHMSQIEDAAGQIAGFGVKLWPIIQDLSQLKALYKDRWETFLGNSGVIQCFANNEQTTTEWISKRLGKTSFQVLRKSDLTVNQAKEGASGQSWSTELHDLLTSEEVARLFDRQSGRQIIIRGGSHAIALERVNYDEDAYFAKHATQRGV